MAAEITVATRLVLICNPNNPTSTALPLERDRRVHRDGPAHICVILDEAYCEFNTLEDPDESLDLLDRHANLVLLRTFSKVYGLCGLRVGYGLCGSEAFVTAVDQVRQPFYCNLAAQAAAVEALRHQDEVERARRAQRRRAGHRRVAGCRSSASSRPQSQANFCWFDLPGGADSEDDVVAGLAGPRGARARRRGARARRARCG